MQLDVKITGKTIVDFTLALEQIVERLGHGELAGRATMLRSTAYSFGFLPFPRRPSTAKRKQSRKARVRRRIAR